MDPDEKNQLGRKRQHDQCEQDSSSEMQVLLKAVSDLQAQQAASMKEIAELKAVIELMKSNSKYYQVKHSVQGYKVLTRRTSLNHMLFET